jgi:DNA-binding CsgD family transcriptional regulator/transcriptional regulator with PAS, ATPase and Fis domain
LARLGENQPFWRESEPQQSLAALLSTSTVGVAIFDRQLRFQTINNALASMNGLPSEAHIGKTIRHILGAAAAKIETALDHVFVTGDPLSNFELTALLPTRSELGHWIENYYPIKAASGKVLQVGVIVLEVTKRKNVEQSLYRLTNKLRRVTKTLQTHREICHRANEQAALSTLPLELLENCVSEMRIVLELLKPQLRLGAVRHQEILFQPEVEQVSARENRLSPLGSHSMISEPYAPCLSYREHQVVQHLAMGKTNKEMATILNLSVRTVETYRARVMLKLGLRSLAELVRYALRNDII